MENKASGRDKIIRFLEFFLVGLVLGVIEDMIAIKAATGASIDFNMVKIAFFIALPFAIFSELVVDHPRFWKFARKKKEDGSVEN